MVDAVAGRAIEAEGLQLRGSLAVPDQLGREGPARVGGIEQRAIGPVVQVKGVTLAQVDPAQDGRTLGHDRAARLAPQLGRFRDRHLVETAVDGVGIFLKVRRHHARIDGREATAHINDVDEDASLLDGAARLGHGRFIGRRAHALRTDVEADTHQPVPDRLAGGQQQGRGLVR